MGNFGINEKLYATPFFSNGYFTSNGIEWCQENLPLYEILGEKFFEHHRHSIESRVCVSLYEDPLWDYDGSDRIKNLIEKSQYYSQLEISESITESETGIIDTNPVEDRDEIILRGTTEDGQIIVQMSITKPIVSIPIQINISFLDEDDSLVSNVNYEIKATQQGKQIMFNSGYSDNGLVTVSTLSLQSDESVDVSIGIKGIGLPENPEHWILPKDQVIMFTVVPEFGAITVMILIIAILSIIALSTKSKLNVMSKF